MKEISYFVLSSEKFKTEFFTANASNLWFSTEWLNDEQKLICCDLHDCIQALATSSDDEPYM